MIVLYLLDFDAVLADDDAALQAGIAATAVAGEDFDAIQGRHNAALHATLIKDFVALERPIDVDQHGLQRRQRKPAQAVAEHVVTEGARRADPVLEGGMSDLGFQLLKAAQTKNKSMKSSQENCRGGNLGCDPGIGHGGSGRAEIEYLVEIAGKGRKLVGWLPVLPFHKCKIAPPRCVSLSVTIIGLVFFPLFVLPLFSALAPQQLPIDLG